MRDRALSVRSQLFVLAVLATGAATLFGGPLSGHAAAGDNPVRFVTEPNADGSQFVYVVFHALDRDGFCSVPPGAVSLHPVIGLPVDFVIEAGDGIIIQSSDGTAGPGGSAEDVLTFSTAENGALAAPVRAFPPLLEGLTDECQAWVKISQSIPGPLRVLVTVGADDGGTLGFVADLDRPSTSGAFSVTLSYRWSLVTWQGEDGAAPGAALVGAGGEADITADVTAMYGWDAVAQAWRGYFPAGEGVPGANDLGALDAGTAYWIAIEGPGGVTWPMGGG